MIPISVVVITLNEEDKIGRCIDSVKKIADEIILLDSHSTDNTVRIAKEKGAIIHFQPFLGFIEQKKKATGLAAHDLVMNIDADEELSDALVASILEVKQGSDFRAFTMNRLSNYCGQFIHHGLWYPDRQLRLFDRRVTEFCGENPHDRVEVAKGYRVKHLNGDLYHYSYTSIEDHITQNNNFSSISAESMHKKGKRSSWFKIIFNPAWAFINGYLFRLGFLDGFYGYIVAKNAAQLTFLKYTKLYMLRRNERANRNHAY